MGDLFDRKAADDAPALDQVADEPSAATPLAAQPAGPIDAYQGPAEAPEGVPPAEAEVCPAPLPKLDKAWQEASPEAQRVFVQKHQVALVALLQEAGEVIAPPATGASRITYDPTDREFFGRPELRGLHLRAIPELGDLLIQVARAKARAARSWRKRAISLPGESKQAAGDRRRTEKEMAAQIDSIDQDLDYIMQVIGESMDATPPS